MKIQNNKLIGDNVTNITTKKKSGGELDLRYLIIHYTASDNYDQDVKTLSTADTPASCHLVIAPDGRITQIGTFKDVLWHAGESSWKDVVGLNRYSIGIEVTSPGPVDKVADDPYPKYKTWYGKIIDRNSGYNFVYGPPTNGGKEQWWAGFTQKQIETLSELVPLLRKTYPQIKDVLGHDNITVQRDGSGKVTGSRKIDPGPCCPPQLWSRFKSRAEEFATNDIKPTDPTGKLPRAPDSEKIVTTGGGNLNVRSGPGVGADILGRIPDGDKVGVWSTTSQNGFVMIRSKNGNNGWVSEKYLK